MARATDNNPRTPLPRPHQIPKEVQSPPDIWETIAALRAARFHVAAAERLMREHAARGESTAVAAALAQARYGMRLTERRHETIMGEANSVAHIMNGSQGHLTLTNAVSVWQDAGNTLNGVAHLHHSQISQTPQDDLHHNRTSQLCHHAACVMGLAAVQYHIDEILNGQTGQDLKQGHRRAMVGPVAMIRTATRNQGSESSDEDVAEQIRNIRAQLAAMLDTHRDALNAAKPVIYSPSTENDEDASAESRAAIESMLTRGATALYHFMNHAPNPRVDLIVYELEGTIRVKRAEEPYPPYVDQETAVEVADAINRNATDDAPQNDPEYTRALVRIANTLRDCGYAGIHQTTAERIRRTLDAVWTARPEIIEQTKRVLANDWPAAERYLDQIWKPPHPASDEQQREIMRRAGLAASLGRGSSHGDDALRKEDWDQTRLILALVAGVSNDLRIVNMTRVGELLGYAAEDPELTGFIDMVDQSDGVE